jgi:hypothetical protein
MPVPYCSDPLKTPWRAALIREPTHRGNIAQSNARHFRHANKCFRQFRAGCATLPTLRPADEPRAQDASVRRIVRPVHVRMPEL